MNQIEYVRKSLELHLFFDRILKEHSLFLELGFTKKDGEFSKVASRFHRFFTNILSDVVILANGKLSTSFLESHEIVTKNTLAAEELTSKLTATDINTKLTNMELQLQEGEIVVSDNLIRKISSLNRKTLPIVENLIEFKSDILKSVLSCKMYTVNYPLLINHIMNEAKMYYTLLSKVENKEDFSNNFIIEQEMFWNNIMKEHAEFIRGLLDPSEKDLIKSANSFVLDYESLLKNDPTKILNASLQETINLRDFKVAGEEGILNCQIKSVIIPLLADHVVREANHFIRILRSV